MSITAKRIGAQQKGLVYNATKIKRNVGGFDPNILKNFIINSITHSQNIPFNDIYVYSIRIIISIIAALSFVCLCVSVVFNSQCVNHMSIPSLTHKITWLIHGPMGDIYLRLTKKHSHNRVNFPSHPQINITTEG